MTGYSKRKKLARLNERNDDLWYTSDTCTTRACLYFPAVTSSEHKIPRFGIKMLRTDLPRRF